MTRGRHRTAGHEGRSPTPETVVPYSAPSTTTGEAELRVKQLSVADEQLDDGEIPCVHETEVLLGAARAEFWRGHHNASLATLCQATGVGSRSLYGELSTKHDLFMRTVDVYCAQQLAGLPGSRDQATSPCHWLLAVATYDDEQRIALGSDGCSLSGSASNLAPLAPAVGAVATTTFERMIELFEEAARTSTAPAEIRQDVVLRSVALPAEHTYSMIAVASTSTSTSGSKR